MSLLQMSLSGGAMILAAALIRALALYKLPKRLFPALWALVLLRLLIPFSLPAGFSVYSLLGGLGGPSGPAMDSSADPALYAPAAPFFPAVSESTHSPAAAGGAPHTVDLWGAAWLLGLLICAGYFAAVYIRCRLKFREALPVQDAFVSEWLLARQLRRPMIVRQSDRIAAPLTYGVLRPVILLPKSTDWADRETLNYVLTHEWTHICRFDGLFKLVLAAAFCLHWFNPLVWLMAALAGRDIELACDEAVLRLFGREARTGYALALLRMEERRSGLAAIGSHFSRNPLEERIKAMMKAKKTSLAALLAAVVLVGGTGVLFATSAKAEDTDKAPRPGYTVENKDSLLSYTGKNGTTYYIWDEGETWTPMTGEEFANEYPTPDVEWWTAEEYAAWLENEKEELQSIIGSQSWTPSTGWFTWTQEMVAETIAKYEEVLAMIEEGYLVSKTVDGDEDTMLVSGGPMQATAADESEAMEKSGTDYESLFQDYKRCGLTFQNNDGSLYWNGRRVRIFADGAEFGGGYASQYEHYDPEGAVDVRTVRERVDNGDGSYNPMGPLVRLEEFEPDQMFLDALEGQRYVGAEFQYEAERTGKELERYTEFGLAYRSDLNQTTGQLSMTWNGQPVRSLFDPERQLWVCNSLGTEGLNLEAVYESGRLAGLRESEEKSFAAAGAAIEAEGAVAESDGNDGSGETLAQRMALYAPYGVSYQEAEGRKLIRYNGQAVGSFADIKPDGGVFSLGSTDGGEIDLTTVYDRDGRLSGVRVVKN